MELLFSRPSVQACSGLPAPRPEVCFQQLAGAVRVGTMGKTGMAGSVGVGTPGKIGLAGSAPARADTISIVIMMKDFIL